MPPNTTNQEFQGPIVWRSPSNIALVKYWGKKDIQRPCNHSVSFTLKEASTQTALFYRPKNDVESSLSFYFDGKKEEQWQKRISRYLTSLHQMPFLAEFDFKIDSKNSFPHSAGIASSASAFSALALCLSTFSREKGYGGDQDFFHDVSTLARLGSGSACRSLYSPVALWGRTPEIKGSSDDYAIPLDDVHPLFRHYGDAILIVDSSTKTISSSQGHKLMENHVMAPERFKNAVRRTVRMISVLKAGDLQEFVSLVESEALELHAMMMTSEPPFILMKPNTLKIIEKIHHFRRESKIPLCFTLDAGPNIHLLYPDQSRENVLRFIQQELLSLTESRRWIDDSVGPGPVQLKGQ